MMSESRSYATIRAAGLLLAAAIGAALLASSVPATVATPEEAARVSQNWLTYMVYQQGNWAGEKAPQLLGSEEITFQGMVVGYHFRVAPSGYIVVPVLKELPPIKAYSETDVLNVKNRQGMGGLLREVLYQRIAEYIKVYGSADAAQPATGDVFLDRSHGREWEMFLQSEASLTAELYSGRAGRQVTVGPLLASTWHQTGPYNSMCPVGDAACLDCADPGEDPSPPSSDTAVVGCVATAAAQIMYFWNWPPSGTGSYSYTWDGDQTCGQPAGSTPAQTLSANFSDAYDWGNMRDSYTGGESQAQRDAAAELCYEAAVAAGMDFGVCGSGTSTDTVLTAFPMYFRYSAATIDKENRTDHTADEWFQLLAAEVDAGRPVQYRINSHSIVCDGYRDTPSDQVHMNYGWGGGANTWYAVDNFYCYWIAGEICPWDEEYMIRGIQPDNLPPVAQCADVTVDADDNCQAAAASIDNGSYDPEGYAVTLEQIPAAPYPLGATLVTLRVTDPQGGVATCEATVTVVDVTPPIITCPSDRTFECDDIGDFGWPTATDNCDSDPAITLASRDSVPGGCPQEYRLVLGYKAEDFSGNAAGCSQTITIIDTTSPVVDCYDTLGFVFTSPTEAEVFWDASATDNCSPAPTVTCDPPSGTTFPIGEHTVTCIADDGCANTDTCAFTFRLVPFDLHPTSCPNPIAVKSVVPAAILGTSDFDVLDVDPSSLRARGVAPLRWTYEDVSTPVGDDPNQNCECTRAKGDGRKDLTLKFDHAALVATFAPGELVDGGSVMLQITGLLKDGTPLAGGDCLILRYKPKDTPAESGPVAVTELGAWNSPNPFNPATVIGYQLPEPGHVKITVFNMLGQVVAHLIDQWQEAGQHSVSWSGERAASGVYFYRLEVGEAQLTRKMLLLK